MVDQLVREKDIAWHAGNWLYNQTSIGIEHEGFVSDSSWFTKAMYRSSAQLAAYLCNKYGIPKDRTHVIGHNEVPDPYHRASMETRDTTPTRAVTGTGPDIWATSSTTRARPSLLCLLRLLQNPGVEGVVREEGGGNN